MPPQLVWPAGHELVHTPATHTWPDAHAVPHAPQFERSVARVTHVPAQAD